jgi:hypothetical protein
LVFWFFGFLVFFFLILIFNFLVFFFGNWTNKNLHHRFFLIFPGGVFLGGVGREKERKGVMKSLDEKRPKKKKKKRKKRKK